MTSRPFPPCPLCGADDRRLEFRQRVLGRHDADYVWCRECGLLQAHNPTWLEEAYLDPITKADTGLVARNLWLFPRVASILYALDRGRGIHVDVAGGYGLLTRLLRDVGFDSRWHDDYTENLFGWPVGELDEPPTLLTAFEVLEHLPDPLTTMRSWLERYPADHVLLTTELFDGPPPQPNGWWYYAPDTGQHISFFQKQTLEHLAAALGYSLTSRGSFHLLSQKPFGELRIKLLTGRLAHVVTRVARTALTSRTEDDHRAAIAQTRLGHDEERG